MMRLALPLVVLLLLPQAATAHGVVSPFLAPEAPELGGPLPDFMPSWSPEATVIAQPGHHASSVPVATMRAGDYDVQFKCPPVARGQADQPACPAYLVDVEDVLGQPVLAVDPIHPGFLAFNALHGGPGPDLPTQAEPPHSAARDNAIHQPHTTFQSRDGGAQWDDNRYYARLDEAARIWGVDNAMGADEAGNLTIVSMYAVDNEDGDRSYKATLTTSGRASQPVDYDRDYVVRNTVEPGAIMHSPHVVGFAAAKATAAMWLEGHGSAVQVRLLARPVGDSWSEPVADMPGCSAISNPIVAGDRLHFLCRIAPGADVEAVRDGDVYVVSIDPDWTVTVGDHVPLRGTDNLVLADASKAAEGGLIAAGGSLDAGKARIQVAYGALGGKWAPVRDYRDQFSDAPQRTASLLSARINAMAYVATSGTVHMIIAEHYDGAESADGSPFFKTYAVVHGGGRTLGTWDVGYGDPASRVAFPAHVAGLDAGVYGDAKDSIVVHTTNSGDERVFIAFGDHGVVRYAELLEVQPTPPAFPPITPAAPVPTPIPGANPAIVGAVAGTLSTAVVARMVAAKKKKTAEAPSL